MLLLLLLGAALHLHCRGPAALYDDNRTILDSINLLGFELKAVITLVGLQHGAGIDFSRSKCFGCLSNLEPESDFERDGNIWKNNSDLLSTYSSTSARIELDMKPREAPRGCTGRSRNIRSSSRLFLFTLPPNKRRL